MTLNWYMRAWLEWDLQSSSKTGTNSEIKRVASSLAASINSQIGVLNSERHTTLAWLAICLMNACIYERLQQASECPCFIILFWNRNINRSALRDESTATEVIFEVLKMNFKPIKDLKLPGYILTLKVLVVFYNNSSLLYNL